MRCYSHLSDDVCQITGLGDLPRGAKLAAQKRDRKPRIGEPPIFGPPGRHRRNLARPLDRRPRLHVLAQLARPGRYPCGKVKNNPRQGRTARNVQMMTTAVAGSFACARQRGRVPDCVP